MSTITIIQGNNNDKDNTRAFMVKGERGDDGVSPTIDVSKEDGVTTLTIQDVDGTKTATIADGDDLTGGVPTNGVLGFDGKVDNIPDGYEVFNSLNSAYCFNNVAEMKLADLVEGDFVNTAGFYSSNDGGGAFYKIRAINNNDVIDGSFLISLKNTELVAEYIKLESCYNVKKLGLKTDGTDNTSLLNNIITKVNLNSTIFFPKGVYTFNSPIVITKRLNLEGEEISITDTDKTLGSILYFDGNFTSGSYVLTLPSTKSLIKNLGVYSNFYELSDDRSLCGKGVDVFTEKINQENVGGIKLTAPAFGSTVKNCRVRGFSGIGILGSTFSIIENNSVWQCSRGISITSDCTVFGNRFFHVNEGIYINGSNNIVNVNRMDSVKTYGVRINTGNSNIIDNLNVDYCQYNAVWIFNGRNNTVNNVKSRCGTIFPFDTTTDGQLNDLGTFEQNELFNDYKKHLGIVLLTGYANYGNEINVPVYPRNPKDSESTLLCSLFGCTVAEGSIIACDIKGVDTDTYYIISNNFYRNYMRYLCYICSGSIRGYFNFAGFNVRVKNSITTWENESIDIQISQMVTFSN